MITDSFDTSKPIITPQEFYGKGEKTCDICIVTFSNKIYNQAVNSFEGKQIKYYTGANANSAVYVFEWNQIKCGIYQTIMGATCSSMDLLAVHQLTGATKFIMSGSAGSLNREMTEGKYIIPTQAYRDEGISYHYAPASDYIEIKNSGMVAEVMKELELPFIQGKVWTTDAIYMETENLFLKHKQDGCLAVDMEISGIQAVCNYYGFELYSFLETGDVLSTTKYSKENLSKANHSFGKLNISLEIARKISSL